MINENLKRLRLKNKYTQEDIAEKLNVSRQSVAKWKNGESNPDITKCKLLAELFDITLDDLVESITEIRNTNINPKGKYIFGVTKMNDREQIILPKRAREVFNIEPGDKLLLLGDSEYGIAVLKEREINEVLNEFKNAPIIDNEDGI